MLLNINQKSIISTIFVLQNIDLKLFWKSNKVENIKKDNGVSYWYYNSNMV